MNVDLDRSWKGRFYFFWNWFKVSSEPILISLSVGESGYNVEYSTDEELLDEAITTLQALYGLDSPPAVVSYQVCYPSICEMIDDIRFKNIIIYTCAFINFFRLLDGSLKN